MRDVGKVVGKIIFGCRGCWVRILGWGCVWSCGLSFGGVIWVWGFFEGWFFGFLVFCYCCLGWNMFEIEGKVFVWFRSRRGVVFGGGEEGRV